MRNVLIVLLLFFGVQALASSSVDPILEMNEKNGYVEPFRMFDNVYYVGDKWVSAYVINTSEGLVLVDTLEFPYSKWIPKNIEKLGLNPKDLKYILITHGHSDHVAGANYLQSIYHSKVIITAEDHDLAKIQALKSKGKGKFLAPLVDSYARDNTSLVLGDTNFNLYVTPGHTKGCLSVDFYSSDKGSKYRSFIVGGNSTNFTGLELAEKYLESVRRIRRLAEEEPRVMVNLANHPRMNQLFERKEKLSNNGGNNPFIDEDGFFEFIDTLEQRGLKKLNEEKL